MTAIRGLFSGLVTYLVEARRELQKVEWPNRPELIRMTLSVLFFSAVVGIALGAVDYLFDHAVIFLLTK